MGQNADVGAVLRRAHHDDRQQRGGGDQNSPATLEHPHSPCREHKLALDQRQANQAASRSALRTRSRPADLASNSAESAIRYNAFHSTSLVSVPRQVPMLAVT